ncbi:MAG: hypothetical protein QW794_04625 [Thermosphaera sp.]
MGIKWLGRNVFTAYDIPARIEVNIPFVHRLKCFDEITTYVDDTITGTNRSTTPYEITLWRENPRGTPPDTPAVYRVACEVYDTGNALRERYELRYLYGKTKYLVYVYDETDGQLPGLVTYTFGTEFFYQVPGYTVGIPERPSGYDLFLEVVGYRNGKKYYYVAKNPTLYPSTSLKIFPVSKAYVTVTYDLSTILAWTNVPVIGAFARFLAWLGVRAVQLSLAIASWFSNLIGINLPVVDARIDWEKKELVVTYENDPAAIVIAIIVAAAVAFGIVLVLAIKDIKTAEARVEEVRLVKEIYDQYYKLVNEIVEYAKTTPDPEKTLLDLLSKLTPPQLPTETAPKMSQMESDLDKLKTILMLGIGGAVVITLLSLAKR